MREANIREFFTLAVVLYSCGAAMPLQAGGKTAPPHRMFLVHDGIKTLTTTPPKQNFRMPGNFLYHRAEVADFPPGGSMRRPYSPLAATHFTAFRPVRPSHIVEHLSPWGPQKKRYPVVAGVSEKRFKKLIAGAINLAKSGILGKSVGSDADHYKGESPLVNFTLPGYDRRAKRFRELHIQTHVDGRRHHVSLTHFQEGLRGDPRGHPYRVVQSRSLAKIRQNKRRIREFRRAVGWWEHLIEETHKRGGVPPIYWKPFGIE